MVANDTNLSKIFVKSGVQCGKVKIWVWNNKQSWLFQRKKMLKIVKCGKEEQIQRNYK